MAGTIHQRIINRYRTPVEALQLAEDIQTIADCRKRLSRVNPWSISDRENADMLRDSMLMMLRTWERYAQLQLRSKYLRPR